MRYVLFLHNTRHKTMWRKSAATVIMYYIASICRNIAMSVIPQQINVIGRYIYETFIQSLPIR